MGGLTTQGGVKQGKMMAVVLNADGTVKRNLGTIGYFNRNLLFNFIGGAWTTFWANRRIRRYNEER